MSDDNNRKERKGIDLQLQITRSMEDDWDVKIHYSLERVNLIPAILRAAADSIENQRNSDQ